VATLKERDEKDLKKIESAQEKGLHAYAAELGRRYVAMYPDDPEGKWLLGSSLYQLDRYTEARKTLESAIPSCSSDFLAPVLSTLGEISRDTGDFANAERFFTDAIKAGPEESETYLDFSWMLHVLNRHDDAETWLRRGIKAGAAPLFKLYLGLSTILTAKGDVVKAAEAISKVLEEVDSEHAETALEDVRHLAELKGIDLPNIEQSPQKNHKLGNITANIHRKFFAEIAAGRKKIEYRGASEFWQNKVDKAGEPPFHFRIINGMTKQAPELTVIVEKVLYNIWEGVYEFHLGEVINIKNWDREKEAPIK
jgi:tetratricopeptide (TPR) repeat protein